MCGKSGEPAKLEHYASNGQRASEEVIIAGQRGQVSWRKLKPHSEASGGEADRSENRHESGSSEGIHQPVSICEHTRR